jgi:OPT family oligopeptide transporter
MTSAGPNTPASSANGEIPTLPANATPEEKDLHWFRYHYQGDHQRQLTVRAVLMGGMLGMLMAVSNLYTTLKLGWAFGVAITSCVLSYVLWNALRSLSRGRLTPMSMLENNCMQSTASAAGMSTGGSVGAAFGALLLMAAPDATSLAISPWYVLVPFVIFTATLGVFLAIPLKRQLVNHEQLAFPSGIAAAETLRSLYSEGREAMQKASALVIAMCVGGVVGLLRGIGGLADMFQQVGRPQPWLERLHHWCGIPEVKDLPTWMAPIQGLTLRGYGFEPSVLLIGAGMIVGLRVSLSMLAGSLLLYLVVVPWLVAIDRESAAVAGYVTSLTISNNATNPIRWALWGGTAVMVAASLTSVALQWRTFLRAFGMVRRARNGGADADALAAIEVPNSWFWVGLIPSGIGLVVVQFYAFSVSIPLGIIAVLMSAVVALVCCRATGETDTTPIGAMGKLTQLLYAVLPGASGNATINLMSAGSTAAAGASSADLLTDLKSGYLLGANPRRQFIAQFIGVFFGTLAVIPAWYLLVPDRAALEAFNPPAANMWKAVAELLTAGIHLLPVTARWAIAIGALVGIALPLYERLFPKHTKYMPSAIGLGLAWVIPFQNALSFAIGAVIALLWMRWRRTSAERLTVPIASGLVAGESLVAAFIAICCTVIGLALKS